MSLWLLQRGARWLCDALRDKMGLAVPPKEQEPSPRRGDLDLEANRILRALAGRGVLYRVNREGLLLHLLRDYHDGQIFKATPDQVRVAAARALGFQPDMLPLDSRELAAEVIEKWLRIDKLPRDEFIAVQQEAIDDLRQISSNIAVCKTELNELTDRKAKDAEQDGDSHRAAYLEYKIAQNLEARDELLSFLERGVADEVLHRVSRTHYAKFLPASFFWFRFPYHFRHAPSVYSPASLSEVRNKFREEPLSEVGRWERLFEDDRPRFHTEVGKYIESRKVVDGIRAKLRNHHRLVERAEVLEQALDVYEDGKHALFCNVTPVQIEGLVGDWARELGISEKELRKAALTLKIDQIKKTEPIFGDFEYFRFGFPVLRNRVAHGRFESANVDQVANLLLLDLADVCRRLYDEQLPTNRLVDFLRRLDSANPDYEKAYEYVAFRNVQLPSLYGLDSKRAEADMILSSDGWWVWLDARVASREPDFLAEARDVAIALKKAGLDGGRSPCLLQKIDSSRS